MQIPVIPNESEAIWLKELYRRYQLREPIDQWAMRIALRDKLPTDFSTSQINPLFMRLNGVTLLGVLAVDPDSERIRDTERVIIAIRELLIKSPQDRNVTAAQIANHLNLDEPYTEELFGLMSSVGSFFAYASGSDYGGGLSSINVDREECLKEFLAFRDIETQVHQMLAYHAQAAQRSADLFDDVLNQKLRRPDSMTTVTANKEIFQLKPTIYGVGVDLKALWSKVLAWCRH